MQHGAAAGGALPPSVSAGVRPLLWIDGVPRPEAAVTSLTETGPLARREVALSLAGAGDAVAGRRAVVAEPLWLDDDSAAWRVLAEGTLQRVEQAQSAGAHTIAWRLVDAWSRRLDEPIRAGWSERDGALVPAPASRLGVGAAANRSEVRWPIGGRAVYVPTLASDASGPPWRLVDALAFLAAAAALPLSWRSIDDRLKREPLSRSLDLDTDLATALERLLTPGGLTLACRPEGRSGGVPRRIEVVDAGTARRVRIPARPAAVAVDRESRPKTATKWIALGGRNAAEATFDLVGGWDPGLETASDTAFDRTASPDFALYRDVFRTWVLNEDGRFTGEPFHRGPAPDLAAVFDHPRWTPRPLRLGDTLTPDTTGRPRRPVVEVTFDGGATWSAVTGRVLILDDRAGVYLDDDTLDPAWLSGVRAGTARLRVTATLTDPSPLRVERWDGNPFAGDTREAVVDAGDRFERRYVDASSVIGQPDASVDDRDALRTWLDRRIDDNADAARQGLRVHLPGSGFTALQTGDRVPLDDLADALPIEAKPAQHGRVTRIEHRFAPTPSPGATLTLNP